jgi:CheY-like chemotaxis protein
MQMMGARVLVVEDDDDVRRMLETALIEAGFTVRCAVHGAEALLFLNHEIPNILLLDLMLPLVNGIEVLRTIRRQPHFATLPVVVVTGTATTAFDLQDFGPLRVMRKPIDLDALASTIHQLVRTSAERDDQ